MKRAIISVFDKTGLEAFAKGLDKLGIKIYSTGGSAKFIKDLGIEVVSISDYTDQPEILEGRVKSLHPKIHGGILARRNNPQDLKELSEHGIELFDLVVVNLYPFKKKVAESIASKKSSSLIEDIDIGGPTMLRAAAKNSEYILPVCDPSDYGSILTQIEKQGNVDIETRRRLACKTFSTTAEYDSAIARYFSLEEKLVDEKGNAISLAPIEGIVLERVLELRYGENPHQHAALYKNLGSGPIPWEKIQGKELSYNNILDSLAALELLIEIIKVFPDRSSCAVIKHSNPCGAAVRPSVLEAIIAAKACDPVSAFGGIVAIKGKFGAVEAEELCSGFLEVVLIEALTPEAAEVFAKKKNVRVIVCNFDAFAENSKGLNIRSSFGLTLMQSADYQLASIDKQVVGEAASNAEIEDLRLAWAICKHVKSNAVVAVKGLQAIGIGAGQMSRVDSARLVVSRARSFGFNLENSVAASDAFLPFPDTLEILNDSGISALVQPGGSIKDEEVFSVAKQRKMKMFITGERHFKH